MLQFREAFSSLAVDDLAAAKDFYGTTLGLQISTALPNGAGPLWLRVADERGVMVYPKPSHTPASYTVLNLVVDDIEQAVDMLTARGIAFLLFPEYDQDERAIYHGEGHSIAWFTDPSGNGLCVVQLRSTA